VWAKFYRRRVDAPDGAGGAAPGILTRMSEFGVTRGFTYGTGIPGAIVTA